MSLNLFPDQKVDPSIQSIGKGFWLKWLQENLIIIYHKGVVIETHEFKNGMDKRILVVDLVTKRKVTKYLLSTALGISRQSIDDWLALYERSGYEGLINSYKGGTKQGRQATSEKLPVHTYVWEINRSYCVKNTSGRKQPSPNRCRNWTFRKTGSSLPEHLRKNMKNRRIAMAAVLCIGRYLKDISD